MLENDGKCLISVDQIAVDSWRMLTRLTSTTYSPIIPNFATTSSHPTSITKESASNFAAPNPNCNFFSTWKISLCLPNPWTPCISPWHSHGKRPNGLHWRGRFVTSLDEWRIRKPESSCWSSRVAYGIWWLGLLSINPHQYPPIKNM